MNCLLRLLITLPIALGTSCGHPTSEVYQNKPASAESSKQQVNKSGLQDPNLLCGRISEIQVFPFKGERGEDAVYDEFMAAGDAVVPCLIERVTDTSKILDPRQEPGFPDVETRLGDIAYFLIVDITKIQFTELLPPDVQKRYKDEGVHAYFKFVEKPSNRKELQDNLYAWYRKKHVTK